MMVSSGGQEGLPCEERLQRLATKRRMHPSCKAVTNVQRCWWEERKQIAGEGGGTPTAKLRSPFQHHGFMTNWGLGLVEGIIYYFILERRYETKKLRFNFRLLLPFVVPFMRALFEHDF